MKPDIIKVVKALESLCHALDLGSSESATEELFLILAMAFSSENVTAMEQYRQADEGLSTDMRWTIADRLIEAQEQKSN